MNTTFDRDTAVRRRAADVALIGEPHDMDRTTLAEAATAAEATATCTTPSAAVFDADVSPDWRAGRGPHGGYLAAMLLRALTETVADSQRAPRSLTIHYARAPEPGPVEIRTTIERAGRSLSTLSARMEQDGRLMALALAAFSVPWSAPEIAELPLPDVEPAEPAAESRFRPTRSRRRSRATWNSSRAWGHGRSPAPDHRWRSAVGSRSPSPSRSMRWRSHSSAMRSSRRRSSASPSPP
jgi:acyl-coenzyme A thioesterase PaaI-like protein